MSLSNLPTGAQRVIELLRDEGVDRVFGNPGSTELALVNAIAAAEDIAYCLGLHEGCIVPAADGYAQATGRTAFCQLHTMSGLGNAIGTIANVKANGTPMVIVAGQQDRRLLEHDPLLGYDLVAVARPVVKWAAEVRAEADLGTMLRRAFQIAATAPTGPVFLAMPHDLLLDPAPTPIPPRNRPVAPGAAAGAEQIASALAAARAPAIIVGQELATPAGQAAVVALAERLGAPMFGAFNMQRGVVPPTHPLWRGDVPGFAGAIAELFSGHDCVLYAGGQAFQLFGGPPGPPLPESIAFIHVAPAPEWLGRSQPAAISTSGDLAATLEAVRSALPDNGPSPAAPPAGAAANASVEPRFDGAAAARLILARMPEGAIIHNELPSVGWAVRGLYPWTGTDQFYSSKQTIGWAMGAAIGVALGHERKRRAIVVVGDGSAALSLPALWSAAHERVPVIYAVVDNSGYAILENHAAAMPFENTDRSSAFSITSPTLDFARLAEGFGVAACLATNPAELERAMDTALAASGPFLIHVKVAPALPT